MPKKDRISDKDYVDFTFRIHRKNIYNAQLAFNQIIQYLAEGKDVPTASIRPLYDMAKPTFMPYSRIEIGRSALRAYDYIIGSDAYKKIPKSGFRVKHIVAEVEWMVVGNDLKKTIFMAAISYCYQISLDADKKSDKNFCIRHIYDWFIKYKSWHVSEEIDAIFTSNRLKFFASVIAQVAFGFSVVKNIEIATNKELADAARYAVGEIKYNKKSDPK